MSIGRFAQTFITIAAVALVTLGLTSAIGNLTVLV
jgi:hypothetical protein